MLFRQLFDAETCTYSYLLADTQSKEAVLIDSVIDRIHCPESAVDPTHDKDIRGGVVVVLVVRFAVERFVYS